MRALSPNRRLSITKNTFYPSVAHERRPSEVGNAPKANNKIISKDLDTNKQIMERMHSKSMSKLDHQRKLLEKSMLAYTEKMKQVMDNRTNSIFRGIQIRIASNPDSSGPRSLPASVDLTIASSIPVDSANLRRRKLHTRRYGALSERGGMKAPIEEETDSDSKPSTRTGARVRSISADTLRRARQTRLNTEYNSVRGVRYSSPNILEKPVRLPLIQNNNGNENAALRKRNNENCNSDAKDNTGKILRDSTNELVSNSEYLSSPMLSDRRESESIITKPKIHIAADDTKTVPESELVRESTFYQTHRTDSASDSAYSSCTDDDESWSTADESVSDNGEHKPKSSVRFVEPNPLEGNLLTVPRVHKRKRNNKGKIVDKTKKYNQDNLLRKAILKNAHSSQENLSQ